MEPCLIPLLFVVLVNGASPCVSPDKGRQQGTVSPLYSGIVPVTDGNNIEEYDVREELSIGLGDVRQVTEVKLDGVQIKNVNHSIDGVTWKTTFEEEHKNRNNSGFLARFVSINATGHENASVEVMGCHLDHFSLITENLKPGNTTWTTSNKPILVTKEIIIDPLSTLTMNPGVKVIFNVDAGIVNQGLLIVNGTARKSISLRGLHDNKWPGITVFNSAMFMNHVDVVNGTSLESSANSSSAVITINNSRIDVDKLELNASLLTINITSSNMSFNSMKINIANESSTTHQEKPHSEIRNGKIFISSSNLSGRSSADSSNSRLIVRSEKRSSNHSLVLQDSTISGTESLVNVSSTSEHFNVTIRENRFRSGVVIEGSFDVVDVGGNHFQTSSSLFIDIGERIQRRWDNIQYAAHRFASTELNWRQEKIYRTNNLSMVASVVGNNFTGSEVRVSCPYRMTKPVTIFGNEFRRSVLQLGTPDVVIKKNKFIRKTPQIIYNGTTYKYQEIDASENFWGCRSTAAIERKILDYKRNTDLPKITYMPYFKDINMTTLEYNTSFIACDGNRLGGHVGIPVVLSRDRSPYTAVSDIFVGENDSLTIEAGVKIRFKKGVAFTVDGSLFLRGSPANPVELVPATEGREWKGLILGPKIRRSVRLVGGADDREGTVLVWSRTQYAPMCFSEGEFNHSHAAVICRMAGFDPAGGVSVGPLQAFSGGMSEYVRYSFGNKLVCSGEEPDLINCSGDNSSCGYSYGYPDKPFVRCLGDRINGSEKASSNVIQLTNVIVKGTVDGILLAGNVSIFDNVTSLYSKSAGVIFDAVFTAEHLPEVRNLTSSFNNDGVVIESDKPYRNIVFKGCSIIRNERNAFLMGGYPSVLIRDSVVSDNKVGIYSDHHDDINVAVESSKFSNLDTVVYLGSRESVPVWLWSSVYRSKVTLTMINSSVVNRKPYKWFPVSGSMIGVRSTSGSVTLRGNKFRNLNFRNIISLSHRSSEFVIEDNVFTNNTGSNIVNVQSLYFYDTPYPPLTDASGSITSNVFQNNSGTALVAVDLGENYRTRISGNTMRNNNATYGVSVNAGEVTLTNNTLMNPPTTCEVSSQQEKDVSLARNENNFGLNNTSVSYRQICFYYHHGRLQYRRVIVGIPVHPAKYTASCNFCLSRNEPEEEVAPSVVRTT